MRPVNFLKNSLISALFFMFFSQSFLYAELIPKYFYDEEQLYQNEGLIQLTPQQEMQRRTRQQSNENFNYQNTGYFTEEEIQEILSDEEPTKSAKPSFQDISFGLLEEAPVVSSENEQDDFIDFEIYDFE